MAKCVFFLSLFCLLVPELPANASPKTYKGNKGEYTVDYQAGTYRGCIYNKGCISLGRDKKSGPSSWSNSNYSYAVDDFRIAVYHNGKLIFEDSFKGVGQCATSSVYQVTSRLINSPDSGTDIQFSNGIGLVSYDIVPAAQNSKRGDPVRICLISIPKNCPPGDDRGRYYAVTNLRTQKNFSMYDSQHLCGGA
jgi:hypothetical protein